MSKELTLDNVQYLRCKIREHPTHMLACMFKYYTDTLEGRTYKQYEIFARDFKVDRHGIRNMNAHGYGLGDPAGFFVHLNQSSSCNLRNVRMHNDGVEVCDYIICKKSD